MTMLPAACRARMRECLSLAVLAMVSIGCSGRLPGAPPPGLVEYGINSAASEDPWAEAWTKCGEIPDVVAVSSGHHSLDIGDAIVANRETAAEIVFDKARIEPAFIRSVGAEPSGLRTAFGVWRQTGNHIVYAPAAPCVFFLRYDGRLLRDDEERSGTNADMEVRVMSGSVYLIPRGSGTRILRRIFGMLTRGGVNFRWLDRAESSLPPPVTLPVHSGDATMDGFPPKPMKLPENAAEILSSRDLQGLTGWKYQLHSLPDLLGGAFMIERRSLIEGKVYRHYIPIILSSWQMAPDLGQVAPDKLEE